MGGENTSLWEGKDEGMSRQNRKDDISQHLCYNNAGHKKSKLPPVRDEEGVTQFMWKPRQHNEFDIASD